MPRKKSGNFDQQAYVTEYINTHIVRRVINFNIGKPEDMKVLEWIDAQPEKISPYLKRLVVEDMQRREQK